MPFPAPGVTLSERHAVFAAVAPHAERVFVSLFDGETETRRVPLTSRMGGLHFGEIAGVRAGDSYGLRAAGPFDPARGHRYDAAKLLIDPYARAIDRPFAWHPDLAKRGVDTASLVPKCVVTKPFAPAPPLPPGRPGLIYELPVCAFTKLRPDVPEPQRGTVAALKRPSVIAHLKRIGADTVELLPLMAWIDERHLPPLGLTNAWGYNPITFFAPDPRLAPGGFDEIRETIATLHQHGIRVLLDVVFNHTGESDAEGATLSLRGLDNALYYRHRGGHLVNDTGCGNTLALDRLENVALVMDALRLWASTGLDGFRYDLATVLGRTEQGYSRDAPLIAAIEQDPQLKDLIHIAEPWDAGPGGYQLGKFPAKWLEWNNRYRDDVRRFWRGDAGAGGALATRLAGSSDVFAARAPSASVNYVAAHDGFTVADVVSFAKKQNHANGEGNRDGDAHEVSWRSETPDADVRALLATLLLSRGTPMLTAGDEFGRSQQGNNNAYAQDNAMTWLDWSKADEARIDFVGMLMKLRKTHAEFFADRFLNGDGDAKWSGADGGAVDWHDPDALGLELAVGGKTLKIKLDRLRKEVTVEEPAARKQSRAPPDALVATLAAAAGIAPDWWEVDGTHHTVSVETQRALLAAMALPLSTTEEARESLASLAREPLQAVKAGEGFEIPTDPQHWKVYRLLDEAGVEQAFIKSAGAAVLHVPALTAGTYRLIPERASDRSLHLIVSPGTCFLPEDIAAGGRRFGLASHLYALRDRRDSGIGDFETLARFAEMAGGLGAALAGVNPLHAMFPGDRGRVSPYQPSDRRLLDPIYIDLDSVPQLCGLPPAAAPDAGKLRPLTHADYAQVWALKDAHLRKLFASKPKDGKTYDEWLQWIADAQLAAAARRGRAAGLSIGLYRDLALGCAYDGVEVKERPDLFAAKVSLGAPPDPFSASGQIWNLPPFNPLVLAAEGMQPYRAILQANMRHAGALRIDHILGFNRQFWVPRGATGAEGAYVAMNQQAFIALTALESQRAKCLVIGEDLGTVPEGLSQSLAKANILSYRVLWFEQDAEGFKPPDAYPPLAAACLSSHDLKPFPGWLASATSDERRKLDSALAAEKLPAGDPLASTHAYLARTPSALMLVQADDLTGETEPLNVPGTDTENPNWRRRLSIPVEEIAELDATRRVLAAVKRERP